MCVPPYIPTHGERKRLSLRIPAQPRQVVNNKRIHVNFYHPLEREDTTLVGGYNYAVLEYDFRTRQGKADKSAKFYGLAKSSLLHKPDAKKGEDPMQLRSSVITLDLGKLPEVNVLPTIAGNINSESVQTALGDRLWYSTGVLSRKDPMVVFRFSSGETPMEQRLDYVYVVLPQADAKPGLAVILQEMESNGTAAAAAEVALHRIAHGEISADPEERGRMQQAARIIAEYHASAAVHGQMSESVRAGNLPLGMVAVPVIPALRPLSESLIDSFDADFRNLFGYLGRTPAGTTLQQALTLDDYQLLQQQTKANLMGTACILSKMAYAARNNVNRTDTHDRVSILWREGPAALATCFTVSSPAVAAKM